MVYFFNIKPFKQVIYTYGSVTRNAEVTNRCIAYDNFTTLIELFQGDPLYVQFWERVQDQREDMVFNSIQEGLDLLLGETQVKYY